jgi:catechol 2,3-dioxygenase-like lactoylglutathione lyase family enzyme
MAAIRHVEFWVSDLKKSLDFYKVLLTALGWNYVDRNGFSFEETKIYFLKLDGVSPAQKTFGPRHICFEAKDEETVDAIARFPMLSGKILHGSAVLHEDGSYMLVFQDPDDYILEVACKTQD